MLCRDVSDTDPGATGAGRLVWDGFLVAVVLMVVGLAAGCAGGVLDAHLALEYRPDQSDSACE